MGPGGRFCRSDNAPQDGIAQERQGRPIAAANQHPMPDLTISNRSRRRFRPVYFGDIQQPIHHLGLRSSDPKRRESVVTLSAHLSSKEEMGTERLPASKRSPLSRRRPIVVIPGKGVWYQWGQFGMRASSYAPPNIERSNCWKWCDVRKNILKSPQNPPTAFFNGGLTLPPPSKQFFANISLNIFKEKQKIGKLFLGKFPIESCIQNSA